MSGTALPVCPRCGWVMTWRHPGGWACIWCGATLDTGWRQETGTRR